MPVFYHLGKFPPSDLDWHRLLPLIGPANAGLARYDGLLSAIPNVHVLLSPLVTQEAVLSSKIEGTHVTMSEVLEIQAGADSAFTKAQRDDTEEVLNYRQAMRSCVTELAQKPISQHLLRSAHSRLMRGVRGRDQMPGSYRVEQNWIGTKGCKIEEAGFVPVPIEHLQSGMDRWEQYLRSDSELDVLVQLAILHVEFEALHPFKDGNGRLGRMFLPLFLYERKLLCNADFYMSAYLEANRDEYQDRLRAVSRDDNWTGWCEFFLKAIFAQARENERKARQILELYDRVKVEIAKLTRSQYAISTTDFLFENAIFQGPAFTSDSGIPKPSANRILMLLRDHHILATVQEGKGRRPGIFVFRELLNIAEGKPVW
jgi:Fic family protein